MVIYLHVQMRVSYGSSQYECAMSLDVLCAAFSWSQKKEPLRTVMALKKNVRKQSVLCPHPAPSMKYSEEKQF